MQKIAFKTLLKKLEGMVFKITFWDGESEIYGNNKDKGTAEPVFNLIINSKLDLSRILSNPILSLGEAYMEGEIEVEGDLKNVLELGAMNKDKLKFKQGSLLQKLWKKQKSAPIDKQQKGVKTHYDTGNDFFKLWLDETMNYSSAYFHSSKDSLKQAQIQKMDLNLKKLNLKEDEKLLDIGCGWGGLIIRAAEKYGARSVGVTLSEEQYRETKERIKKNGLQNRAKVKLIDYRELVEQKPIFDKIISVGMFEHVGKDHISEYFDVINKMLKPEGLSLLQSLTHPKEEPTNSWLQKHIFPWGYIPSLREVVWELPEHNFHLRDVESLRRHYAMTTERWARNFEQVTDKIEKMYDQKFVRKWRIFLRGCPVSFYHTGLNVHQLLFSKGLNNSLPLSRKYIYE